MSAIHDMIYWESHITLLVFSKIYNLNLIMGKHHTDPRWVIRYETIDQCPSRIRSWETSQAWGIAAVGETIETRLRAMGEGRAKAIRGWWGNNWVSLKISFCICKCLFLSFNNYIFAMPDISIKENTGGI